MREARLIFWDFDGVIKDSVEAKSLAFEELFRPFGKDLVSRVRKHHETNGGMSRLDKIPLYLRWAGEPAKEKQVEDFCKHFSDLSFRAVLNSSWVPGVREYLMQHCHDQYFILVTATPQSEIVRILLALELATCFREVYGAPQEKSSTMKAALCRMNCQAKHALVIGDSEVDWAAARQNSLPFLLRRTSLNTDLLTSYKGPTFSDLINE